MRLACIDVGSNTTRLLVAEAARDGMASLSNDRVFTLIGRSIGEDGRIPQSKIDETAAAVAGQADHARAMGVEALRAVATAAVRRASNPEELTAAVERHASVPLEVLDGDEEARLAYRGATHALGGKGSLAVVDVGGGSTEIAFGSAEGEIEHVESVMIGSSTVAESFFASDPPSPKEVKKARAEVAGQFESLNFTAVDRAVAIGGSAGSLRHMAGRKLGKAEFAKALDLLLADSAFYIAARFELDHQRVRLLPAGLVILEELSRRLEKPLRICKGGLREGVILEMIEERA